MKLLFITQKIREDDDDLASVILWIKQFVREGFDIRVICLEKGKFSGDFPVYSLGKEKGYGKIRQLALFLKYIFTVEYDRVFVHMNMEYFTLGGWYWFLRRVPMYSWYTHYTMHIHLRLAAFFTKRMFAATSQSLPQYDDSPKKVVTGHGIDVRYWLNDGIVPVGNKVNKSETKLLSVHRICRSKRIEIPIKALCHLPENYSLIVYGRDVEKDYFKELNELVKNKNLQKQVEFAGPVPMAQLKNVYGNYRLMANMAYETIDKSMLEAMLFGVYPVTTKANSLAIGLPVYPQDDRPETIAKFITEKSWRNYDQNYLARIVNERHGLPSLIKKMGKYIKDGK